MRRRESERDVGDDGGFVVVAQKDGGSGWRCGCRDPREGAVAV